MSILGLTDVQKEGVASIGGNRKLARANWQDNSWLSSLKESLVNSISIILL